MSDSQATPASAPAKPEVFACEVPLRVTPAQERELLIRLDCARQIYNACLGEGLRRLRLARESRAWQAAREMPKKSKERREAFAALRDRFGLSCYSLISPKSSVATRSWRGTCQFTKTWLGERVDSQCVQVLAARAWATIERYMVGAGGRPRFKRKGQVASVEAKSSTNPLRWERGGVTWKGLRIMADDGPRAESPEVAHGLALVERGALRYVRLVHRGIRGESRFFAQLVLRGSPLVRCRAGEGVVGIDLGPSTLAYVADNQAELLRIAPSIEPAFAERRRIQRALDRSRRATNPGAFRADGTVVPGPRAWVRSRKYLRLRGHLAESERRMAATRKSEHGHLANRLIELGGTINLEKLSYVSFQKCFGRSVGARAPGMLISTLLRKAVSAGVTVVEINPWRTRLSQTCVCGAVAKKPLSERVHRCPCGVFMQRDLMSAYLARFVSEDGSTLHADQALAAWSGRRSMALRAAWRGSLTSDGAGLTAESHAELSGSTESWSPALPPIATSEVLDDVALGLAQGESQEELVGVGGPDMPVGHADVGSAPCVR